MYFLINEKNQSQICDHTRNFEIGLYVFYPKRLGVFKLTQVVESQFNILYSSLIVNILTHVLAIFVLP